MSNPNHERHKQNVPIRKTPSHNNLIQEKRLTAAFSNLRNSKEPSSRHFLQRGRPTFAAQKCNKTSFYSRPRGAVVHVHFAHTRVFRILNFSTVVAHFRGQRDLEGF